MSDPTFDLQSHSTYSDGSLPPAEVVARAAQAGVRLLALTDHDAVGGVGEAIAAGREHGVRVVAAAEISALDGDHEDLHVLGYCFDHTDPTLRATLADFRADRNARGGRMADALEDLGFHLERKPLRARDEAGLPVGRPHLAAAVLHHPGNAHRLREEGLADTGAIIEAYLIPGTEAYRRRTRPTIAEAIDVIHAAGGVAVWAHPFWDIDDPDEVLDAIDRFTALGLDGVEAFYVTHDAPQTRLVASRCEELGLLTTGSADFHGPSHERFNAFRAFSTYGHEPRLGPIADAGAGEPGD